MSEFNPPELKVWIVFNAVRYSEGRLAEMYDGSSFSSDHPRMVSLENYEAQARRIKELEEQLEATRGR